MTGITLDNVFDNWDLNPLAAATGISRDTLSLERDALLQPLYASYRSAALRNGFPAAADDYSLFFDDNFRNYCLTGLLPVSPAGSGGFIAATAPIAPTAPPPTPLPIAPTSDPAIGAPDLNDGIGLFVGTLSGFAPTVTSVPASPVPAVAPTTKQVISADMGTVSAPAAPAPTSSHWLMYLVFAIGAYALLKG